MVKVAQKYILQVQKEDRSLHLGQGGVREASRSRSPDALRLGPLSLAGLEFWRKAGVQEQSHLSDPV